MWIEASLNWLLFWPSNFIMIRFGSLERDYSLSNGEVTLEKRFNVPVNSKTAHPPSGESPGIWLALSSVQWGIWPKMRPARWGNLTFVSKRLSAVGSKRISQLFDSAGEPRSRVIAVVDSTWVFLLLSFYIVLSWNMPLDRKSVV